MRLVPFSYFCTCWKVTPSRFPSSVWDMPLAMRRARMRWPTSISCDVVLFVLDFMPIAATLPKLNPDGIKFRLSPRRLTTVNWALRTAGLRNSEQGIAARRYWSGGIFASAGR